MRWKRLTGQSITGPLTAGMVSVGLLPVAASAAEATDPARGKPVVAGGSHGGFPAANANDGKAVGKRPQGSYAVSALVDPTDTVVESDNANNSRTTASPPMVGQSPGLDLEVRSISSSPANPAAGAVHNDRRRPGSTRSREHPFPPGESGPARLWEVRGPGATLRA